MVLWNDVHNSNKRAIYFSHHFILFQTKYQRSLKMFAKIAILLFVAVSVRADADGVTAEKFSVKDSSEHSSVATRDALIEQLFGKYNKDSYPENSTVRFGLSVINVDDLNEEHGILTTNTWLRIVWDDNRFTWDAEKLGINVLRIPSQNVWTPDTTIYNGVDQTMDCTPTQALIYPNGKVLWVPPCRIQSFCNITLTGNPYGVNECEMKFGSWVFDGLTMGFDFYKNEKSADISDYTGSQRWKIVKNTAEREEKKYDCCLEPYISLSYHLGFQKPVPEGHENCKKE